MSSSYVYGTLLGAHWLPERACPRCGKRFEPTDRWVFKIGSTYFCSYHCHTAALRDSKRKYTSQPHKRVMLSTVQLRKIFSSFEAGKTHKEVALALSIGSDTVRYYYRKYYQKGTLPSALQRRERSADR